MYELSCSKRSSHISAEPRRSVATAEEVVSPPDLVLISSFPAVMSPAADWVRNMVDQATPHLSLRACGCTSEQQQPQGLGSSPLLSSQEPLLPSLAVSSKGEETVVTPFCSRTLMLRLL
jgi:hypothetical protein